MKESSTVGHEKMKKNFIFEFYCHLLEFYCRALEFYCPVFLVIFKTGVLMSLESYCRWGSTVECNYIFFKYLKNWGSIVVGVLLFLEFFCLWSSTVSIPAYRLSYVLIKKIHTFMPQNYVLILKLLFFEIAKIF